MTKHTQAEVTDENPVDDQCLNEEHVNPPTRSGESPDITNPNPGSSELEAGQSTVETTVTTAKADGGQPLPEAAPSHGRQVGSHCDPTEKQAELDNPHPFHHPILGYRLKGIHLSVSFQGVTGERENQC